MRRLRGNDLKSIQLAKNKELLQKYGRDDAWFESVNECDIRPALIIGDSEVRGEVLRIITEYLRAKFIRAANPDSDDEATDNKKKKKPAKPVPHPQSAVGMKVVGRAYHSLVTLGFEAFQMELGEIDEDDTTEYDVLYDGAMLSDTCVDAVDRAVLDVPSENVKPVSSAFGDILVYSDQGKRQTMEDKHVCISDLNSMFSLKKEQPSQAFFAIYDGHGGTEAADYARNHLHVNLVNHPDFESDIIKALEESFKKTDENFLKVAEKENNLSGCTCIVTFVRGEYMYTAWLGDSQAMLCRNGSEVQNICSPHKPDREDEKKRIEDAGKSHLLCRTSCFWYFPE
ncbi:hypothetical protein, variant [Sphaeroforma arctica JP610]|uniref:PPM-type phosphatase domain-containing protein n=1 Tax=Sphaeroforma arctica JP610 TaxID=667725 RepID=A0A0L0G9P0_9EUKA|nr:hypothetical protein, variant [Sphaeroforma arctica JP610]KNC85747.1 hypothetical protein, variant [Sphaeroforma arctica JP610]|eukprot:XP_014159650.1 hypothetical protein, variant [Sphaeroforma arctica JP610]